MKAKWFWNVLIAVSLTACLDNGQKVDTQFQSEIQAIDDYLAINGGGYYVLKDPYSGIRFEFQDFGEGRAVHPGQKVNFSYSGYLLTNGNTFQPSTNYSGKIDDFPVSGLRYAVSSVLQGTLATAYIPSKYGFGAEGTTSVPPNSTLIYDFYLEEIVRTATQQDRFELDTAAVHDYLKSNLIENIAHESGMRYHIETAGTGDKPVVYDAISGTYKMMLLSGTTIQEGTLSQQNIFGLIDGLKIGIPLIKEGTKVTFYIPSELGYGLEGNGSGIPANANLKFEMTLTSVDTN